MENSYKYNDDYVRSLLAEYEITELEDYLLQHRRPVVKLERGQAGASSIGKSRIGGYPDLPPEIEWPKTSDGKLMTLLAQLNFAQMVEEAGAETLPEFFPKRGLLYIFAGLDEPAYDVEHKVIYIPQPETAELVYRKPEQKTILEETQEMESSPFEVHAIGQIEFPNYAYEDVDELEATETSMENYEAMAEDMRFKPDDVLGRMFGYPEGQHGDYEYEAALVIHTGKKYGYDTGEARKQLIKHFNGDEQKADQEIQDMLMLLELDSDDDVGFRWWDSGVIHLFIRKEDLINLNFDRTYCSIYSS